MVSRSPSRPARARAAFLAWIACAAPAAAGVATVPLVEGRTVARLEVEAPAVRDFVLRGTFPVPAGTYPRADGRSPFAVRDTGGALVPAQTEVVSRWPDDALGADVVEVLARVRRPLDVPARTPIRYEVVYAPHDGAPIALHPAAEALLHDGPRVLLTTRDVFGNLYVADLQTGDVPRRTLRDGQACREWQVVANFRPLAPQAGSAPTLPHLMGVQAWFRAWAQEPVVSLDLLLHNGHSGNAAESDLDDPMGTLYFDRVDLWLPHEWSAWPDVLDPAAGPPEDFGALTRVPLVLPLADGKLHVMPIQAQTVRRLALGLREQATRATEYAHDANLGFARRGRNAQLEELFSWWNPETARYFPQRHALPSLDHLGLPALRADLEARRAWIADALETGSAPGYPLLSPALGWAHPWGIDHGGMAGGDEIDLYAGVETLAAASNAGWRALVMRHRMYTDRQPVALFDLDGRPTEYTRWVVHDPAGDWLPVWCFLTPILWAGDPFGFGNAPSTHVDAVAASGRAPPYEAALRAHQPIDLEHLVRYTAPAKALAWIGNDSLARSALELHAALFRLSYNELPNSPWGHLIPTGLAADQVYVAAHPGIGFTFGRLEGWGLDATTAWYALAAPAWRQRARPWFQRVADVVEAGQSRCSGFIQATLYVQLFGGQYRARQSIEQAILEHALVGLRESVLFGFDPEREARIDRVLEASLRAMISPPAWSGAAHAPWNKLAVGDADPEHAPFCGPPPPGGTADGGDGWQCWSSFAYGFELTGDPLFLQRAEEMLGAPLLPGLAAQGAWNLGNRAALLALAQQLGP